MVVLRYDCCIDALRGSLGCVKTTLMALLSPGWGRLCKLFVIVCNIFQKVFRDCLD